MQKIATKIDRTYASLGDDLEVVLRAAQSELQQLAPALSIEINFLEFSLTFRKGYLGITSGRRLKTDSFQVAGDDAQFQLIQELVRRSFDLRYFLSKEFAPTPETRQETLIALSTIIQKHIDASGIIPLC
jgi:hypothetical protein